ncbi:MAG: uracil-DNA glycosylase family protein [Candidatus Hydrogenedentales bacterium]
MKPIVIIGEAKTAEDHRINSSFVSAGGVELLRLLNESGIITLTPNDKSFISDYYRRGDPRSIDSVWKAHPSIFRTNVFQIHPPANKLEWFCGPRADGIPGYPALIASKYVRKEFESELDRLGDEIIARDPNLIIGLGNTALWALCARTGVGKLRGTTQLTTHCVSGYKLLPTYHPASLFRQWENRPTTIMDLMKAKREADFPDIRRPKCEIWIEPTLDDIERFFNDYVRSGCDLLSVDIETAGSRITCIGFAPSGERAIVIPFDDARAKGGSYWPDRASEARAWELIRSVLIDGSIPKLFQNGMYDIAFLWRSVGIGVRGCAHDTMLLSHALQPESLKGLGYLGSIYTDFGAWKVDHKNRHETIKRDA